MSTQSSRSRLSVPLFLALATLIVSRPAHPQRPAEQGSEEARAAEQGAAGSWEGALTIDDHLYPVMVTLVNLEGGWSGRFSYPVGGITDMPLHSARVAGDTVEFAFRPGYAFRGVLTTSGAVGYRGSGGGTGRAGVGRDRASHNGTHGGATSDAGTSRTGTRRDGTSRDEASRDEASRAGTSGDGTSGDGTSRAGSSRGGSNRDGTRAGRPVAEAAGTREADGRVIVGEATLDGRTFPGVLARPGSPVAEDLARRVREAINAARSAPLVEVARGPGAERIDATALGRLLDAAWRANSDAVVVLHDGELVGEWYKGGASKRIEAMSVTKSVANLAIGRLVTLGAIASIDLPVHTYYPEWREGVKSRITIRHLLDHTSGLRTDQGTGEIYASPDFVRLALDAEVTSEPGTVFFYNNKAVNLLAGIVERAAGKRLDVFLRDDLFAQLGITDFTWSLDAVGNPHVMAGLQIHAADLAKLGQLTLDRGLWEGERLIDESWFDESLRATTSLSPYSGLLWWLIPEKLVRVIDAETIRALREAGVDEAVLARVEPLKGRYESADELIAAYRSAFGDDWRTAIMDALGPHWNLLVRAKVGEIVGYRADGYLGQFIIIYPAERLVAVRMVASSPAYREETDGFVEFQELVRGLAGRR